MKTTNVRDGAFVCSSCGEPAASRLPRCPGCRAFGTLVRGIPLEVELAIEENDLKPASDFELRDLVRIPSGLVGFDYVTDGGFARGRVIQIWGKPGLGKTTLTYQAMSEIAERFDPDTGERFRCAQVTSEEDVSAPVNSIERLEVSKRILLMHESDINVTLEKCERAKVDVLALDSVQMFHDPTESGGEGNPIQLKSITKKVVAYAQRTKCAVIVICQVRKDGDVAGANFVQHVVDGGFHLFKVKKKRLVFWCPRKNRMGQSARRWKCQMDENGKIVDRIVEVEPEEGPPDAPESSPHGFGFEGEGGGGRGRSKAGEYRRAKRR